eukprot:1083697-Prymnesium_polylepis.1
MRSGGRRSKRAPGRTWDFPDAWHGTVCVCVTRRPWQAGGGAESVLRRGTCSEKRQAQLEKAAIGAGQL